jgi:hypothetical protein
MVEPRFDHHIPVRARLEHEPVERRRVFPVVLERPSVGREGCAFEHERGGAVSASVLSDTRDRDREETLVEECHRVAERTPVLISNAIRREGFPDRRREVPEPGGIARVDPRGPRAVGAQRLVPGEIDTPEREEADTDCDQDASSPSSTWRRLRGSDQRRADDRVHARTVRLPGAAVGPAA